MKRWGKDGIGDVSEELPALLVVLVALAVFFSGVAQAYSSYVERERTLEMYDRAESLLSSLRSDPALVAEGRVGIFAYATLTDVNSTRRILDTYDSERIGFEFSVRISDTSPEDALSNVTIQDETFPQGAESVVVSSPCNIIDADGFVRPATISLQAWGFS